MSPTTLSLLLLGTLLASASATKFTVGDAQAWNPNVNYTAWVNKHRPFYQGDWLVFYYTNGQADVAQVDAVAYNTCDASHPISNYSKGRSYAFELNETKRYYFICSYGYCYQGMKLSILVHPLPPPVSAKDTSAAAAAAAAGGRLPAAVVAAALAVAGFLIRLL